MNNLLLSPRVGSQQFCISPLFGPWARLHGANGQNAMTLYNCRSRQCHGTSNGENTSSGLRDMHSDPWESPYGSNGHMIMMWHTYRFRQFHKLQTENICPVVSDIYAMAHRQAHIGQMGKCTRRCTTASLDNSIQLRMEKIHPTVSDFHSQTWCCTTTSWDNRGNPSSSFRDWQFHKSSNWENLSNGFRDMCSSLWSSPHWANDYDIAELQV